MPRSDQAACRQGLDTQGCTHGARRVTHGATRTVGPRAGTVDGHRRPSGVFPRRCSKIAPESPGQAAAIRVVIGEATALGSIDPGASMAPAVQRSSRRCYPRPTRALPLRYTPATDCSALTPLAIPPVAAHKQCPSTFAGNHLSVRRQSNGDGIISIDRRHE